MNFYKYKNHNKNKSFHLKTILENISHISQLLLLIVGIYTYIYTIKPAFDKQKLEYEITQKEEQLKSTNEKLIALSKKTYQAALLMLIADFYDKCEFRYMQKNWVSCLIQQSKSNEIYNLLSNENKKIYNTKLNSFIKKEPEINVHIQSNIDNLFKQKSIYLNSATRHYLRIKYKSIELAKKPFEFILHLIQNKEKQIELKKMAINLPEYYNGEAGYMNQLADVIDCDRRLNFLIQKETLINKTLTKFNAILIQINLNSISNTAEQIDDLLFKMLQSRMATGLIVKSLLDEFNLTTN
jgi:hypothetical protein